VALQAYQKANLMARTTVESEKSGRFSHSQEAHTSGSSSSILGCKAKAYLPRTLQASQVRPTLRRGCHESVYHWEGTQYQTGPTFPLVVRQTDELDSAAHEASHAIADPALLAVENTVGRDVFFNGKAPRRGQPRSR